MEMYSSRTAGDSDVSSTVMVWDPSHMECRNRSPLCVTAPAKSAGEPQVSAGCVRACKLCVGVEAAAQPLCVIRSPNGPH